MASTWPTLATLGVFALLSLFKVPVAGRSTSCFISSCSRCLPASLPGPCGEPRPGPSLAGCRSVAPGAGQRGCPSAARALDDRLPGDVAGPGDQATWAMHRRAAGGEPRRGSGCAPPRSDLPRQDPWALRAALVLVLLLAVIHARGDIGPRLASGLRPSVGSLLTATLPPMVELRSHRRPTPVARRWWPSRRAGYRRSPSPRAARRHCPVHPLPEAIKAEVLFGEATTPLTDLGPGSGEAEVNLMGRHARGARRGGASDRGMGHRRAAGRGADGELRGRAPGDAPKMLRIDVDATRTITASQSWPCCWRRRITKTRPNGSRCSSRATSRHTSRRVPIRI